MFFIFFIFKQKTAYELRISDWSSDVCASDLTICCEDVGGRYVLLDGAELLVDGAMERPNDGKVADDGTFILNDWGSRDALAGTFMAFARDGRPILKRDYAANILNNGLSPAGGLRSEANTYELQSPLRISYTGICLIKNTNT